MIAALLLASSLYAAPPETLQHVRISTDDAPAVARELMDAGYDVIEGTITDASVELAVTERERLELLAEGLEPRVLRFGRPFREIQIEQRGDVPGGYLTYDEILARLDDVARSYPDIAQVVDLTAEYGMPETVDGNHMFAIKMSDNVATREDEPAFMMVSCHHAREIVTPELAMEVMDRFSMGYGVDQQITDLMDGYEIWIAPVWNPDGYEYVFDVDDMWRKNRRDNGDGEFGVDQNRNYPLGWGGPCDGSSRTRSGTYRGPAVASEVETQTMLAWSADQHFAKVIDYHSSGRETLAGYRCSTHPFQDFFEAEVVELSTAASYGDIRPPSAEGEHYEEQLARFASHAFLIETHDQFQPSHDSALEEADRVFPGTLWMLERPIPLSGHVTDGCTFEPLVASISYVGVVFENDEVNESFMPFGRYHAFLPPGDHTVEFSAPGYATVSHAVSVTLTSADVIDVELIPPGGCGGGCDPASLTRRARLKGVKDGASGAHFEWMRDTSAPEYHLNSVDRKEWLNSTDARPAPLGNAVTECSGPDPECTDVDALDTATPLFYQAVSACGPTGEEEGPLF